MMSSFGVLICSLAVLSAAGIDRPRNRRRHKMSVSRSSSSSPSSFSSFSFDGPAGICQNGGTSVTSLTGEHMFCFCATGFEGTHCERVKSGEENVDCYEGFGFDYRGTVSETENGETCEVWDAETRRRYLSSDIYAGRHNYCRNVRYRLRPWCLVKGRRQQLQRVYCAVPRCDSQPTAVPAHPQPESTCGQRTRGKLHKIVGGTVTTVESHPWMAAIFWRSRSQEKVFRCGGSLISACWVLTAAHCFPDGSHTKSHRFSIILGKNALNESRPAMEQEFRVEEIIIHEGFDNSEGNFKNDIALLRLRAKHGSCAEESDWVRSICLPLPQHRLQAGVTCEIAGYGKEKKGLWYSSQYLREAQVSIFADSLCRQKDYYGNMITDDMFCAGRHDWSQDACEGDSGGPLVCQEGDRLFLFGVVSWGDGCAKELRPGVYTRVTSYSLWIAAKTGLASFSTSSMLPEK